MYRGILSGGFDPYFFKFCYPDPVNRPDKDYRVVPVTAGAGFIGPS